jgi:hypothetical protein
MNSSTAVRSASIECKLAFRRHCRCRMLKNNSTWWTHEACLGVSWKTKRSPCRALKAVQRPAAPSKWMFRLARRRHKGHYQPGPGPAGADGGVAGAERSARSASVIPPPGQSSAAILRRRPRGSQDASCRGRVHPRDSDGLLMGGDGRAQVGRRRGRPRRVRRVEQAQGREDLADHGRVLHRGDEP